MGPVPSPETQHWYRIRQISSDQVQCVINLTCGALHFHFLMKKIGREGGGGKGQSKNTDLYDMQKYSKTMQIKQFSLSGIPLCTIIKSSRSGIAISNHRRDPRQFEQEPGPGSPGECGAGSGPAAPTWSA